MPRPKAQLPLVTKVARAFAAVGKLQRAGTNGRYNWTRATNVLEAVRDNCFSQDVLILPNEGTPVYVDMGESNGSPQITECRLPVTYVFKDTKEELPPITINGEGQCTEGKALYKAQTGTQKALLKRFGLMAEEIDNPEYDGREMDNAAHNEHGAHNVPTNAKTRHRSPAPRLRQRLPVERQDQPANPRVLAPDPPRIEHKRPAPRQTVHRGDSLGERGRRAGRPKTPGGPGATRKIADDHAGAAD